MVINLHDSLIPFIHSTHVDAAACAHCLENIATGRREGKHVVIGTSALLKVMSESEFLSSRSRGVFKSILAHRSEEASLLRRVRCYVNVLPPKSSLYMSLDSAKVIVNIPIDKFADTVTIQQGILLAESISDAKFYKKMASVYAFREKMKVPVRAETIGGGGGALGKQYQHYQDEQKRFCLCVVDSDREYPNAAVGSTARAVKKADDRDKVMSTILIIGCREVENLIPVSVYEKMFKGDIDKVSSIDAMIDIGKCNEMDVLRYIDVKSGHRLGWIIGSDPKSDFGKFWRSKMPVMEGCCTGVDPCCISDDGCRFPQSCKCSLLVSLGARVLESALDILEKMTDQKVSELLGNSSGDWDEYGSFVFSWCCGSHEMKVI